MNLIIITSTNHYHSGWFSNSAHTRALIGWNQWTNQNKTKAPSIENRLKICVRNESQKTQITHLDSTRLETQSNIDSEYYLPPDAVNDGQSGQTASPPRSPGNYLAPTHAEYLAPSDSEYMAPSEVSYQESQIDDRPAYRIRSGIELHSQRIYLKVIWVQMRQMISEIASIKNHHPQKVRIIHSQLIR